MNICFEIDLEISKCLRFFQGNSVLFLTPTCLNEWEILKLQAETELEPALQNPN